MIVKDLIEVDTYGYNDDYSIELSSDEEEPPEDRVRVVLTQFEEETIAKWCHLMEIEWVSG